jgi:hypothetical protein
MTWIIVYLIATVVALSVIYHMGVNAPLGEETEEGFKQTE